MKQSKKGLSNWLLLLGVVVLAVAPLVLIKAEFSGADGQAEDAIKEIQPEYKPWFNPLVELPSGEVESLLFSVQAAAGAGVIGYVIGLYKGRSQHQRNKE
ncbi:energy-coupling factor ABC transporter substrate-binding protein [Nostoc sp. FACHB-892]|jgi:cobalt/nickel transport protein|uniref:energy-coupling factor ABC transporter substrate-binding protein n=1 Tax=Nostoc sp. FACHB-892 TaxID=2692843 RepID=UPI0016887C32|nr:energy-coupling factor ABC transporter substrate-binding protein [Nostoc sp. FACHB-892]MBD2726526.1 energy-coupling factor ABC transporter substrate-binding protein [Nostoc sp. FACHB-892]